MIVAGIMSGTSLDGIDGDFKDGVLHALTEANADFRHFSQAVSALFGERIDIVGD